MFLVRAPITLIDFNKIRIDRHVLHEIIGNNLRNECNFVFATMSDAWPGHGGQVPMAEWCAEAFRAAYPYGRYKDYPTTLPRDLEDDIVAYRSRRVITEADTTAWCQILTDAPTLPKICTPLDMRAASCPPSIPAGLLHAH